jgi:ribonuclease G
MTKELFVSSTPHETKVGMVEDDLLAEIYLERENEYTLAGSIYKGRVTRVLPGMQSAFVDIGLERDAFLYVSDFMELEDQDDLDEVPTNRPVVEQRQPQRGEGQAAAAAAPARIAEPDSAPAERHTEAPTEPQPESRQASDGGETQPREPRGWRGRRRRGRRGERMPDAKFARPASEAAPREAARSERSEYGPPPGYQPILLPGESISKYRRHAQPAQPVNPSASDKPESVPGPAELFPEDEPLFAEAASPQRQEAQPERVPAKTGLRPPTAASDAHERQRLEQMNVSAIFGGEAADVEEETEEMDFREEASPRPEPVTSQPPTAFAASAGTMEEEEIDEEEADLGAYGEDLEDDAQFEELEEETRAADDYQPPASQEGAVPEAAAATESAPAEAAAADAEMEEAEADEEEAELEEAQAAAEALLASETGGPVEARAEVRAPAGTAPYTQRAARPAFDRRNRGRRGGRRFRRREPQHVPLISDLLKEGQEILVQIAKEPIGKKGARITSHIALPGRFLVYMPTVNHTGVSRKIASEEERQRLKRIILSERDNGHGGFIVRTAAQGANEEELRADIRFLKGLWAEIKSRAESGKSPALIYHDLNVVERVLRDQVTSDFSAIWVDTEQEYERILRFANRFQPALVRRVKLYLKETPLFEQFGLTEEINKALKSKVWLKSGGYIVINQTEALVAIDVNTGKYVGKTARLEDTIVKTNVDAIKEIVRQVRLRDLGGIIIIDFIDMDERRNRQKVMQALEEALRGDRAPSKVLQFNDFGLVAITRKRVKQSLERTIGAPCPYCSSTGFVKSVSTVCGEIYVEMRKIAKHLEHADVMLRVNPEIAKALKANNGRALNEMEELTKRTIIVKSDPALHQEQFDIN